METIKQYNTKFYMGDSPEHPIAEITFIPEGEDKIIVNHTYVAKSLTGQGIGKQLMIKVIEYARKEHKKIIPTCSFAEKVITSSDEYKDVLYQD